MFHFLKSHRSLVWLALIVCLIVLNLSLFSLMNTSCVRYASMPVIFHNSSESMGSMGTSALKSVGPQSSANTLINLSRADSPLKYDKDSVGAIYQGGYDVTNAEKCPNNGEGVDLVILVTSRPSDPKPRTAIRQTWGSFGQRADVRILFILGTTEDAELEERLRDEQKLYGDVIRGRFHDSYSNLTLKSVSILEWFATYCSGAKFLLKADDDMFINMPRLLSFVKKHEKDENIIFGVLFKNVSPIRNETHKWYAPPEQFKLSVYPDYVTGQAYLMSRDIIHKLYSTALSQTFFRIEDIFITGIVAGKLGIKRVKASEFLSYRIPYEPCRIRAVISIHKVNYTEQYDVWTKLMDEKSKC
ncbi:beta-1,3-galactosyltransferase 1 [Diachasma alloeum]|uniref:beta-1,3-galactosyltransferase 1 n=1 Tax=Diachasma alloeum TaxID=454923 RepID=UPI0007384C2A|nr:beta-1,3-galactosyltransferase 1 [Diachasma alloeum]